MAGTAHYILRIGYRHFRYAEVALDEVLLRCSVDVHAEHHVDIEALVDEIGITDAYRVDNTVAIHASEIEIHQRVVTEADVLLLPDVPAIISVRHEVVEAIFLSVEREPRGAQQEGELHVSELGLLDGVRLSLYGDGQGQQRENGDE